MGTKYNTGVLNFSTFEAAWALYSFLRLVQELGLADYNHTTHIITLLGKDTQTTQDLTTQEVVEVREYLTPLLTSFPSTQSRYFEEACQAVAEVAQFYGWDSERDIRAECIC